MRVLVTGGSGFTGRRVVAQLVAGGHEAAVLCRSVRSAEVVRSLGAAPVDGDLDDDASLNRAFEQTGTDLLVNVASLGFGHAPTIVEAAEAAGIRRAVFVSTTAIFTKLNAPSKAVRVAAEATIQASNLEATILRPTMIYGAPGDRNLERLIALLRKTPVVPLPGSGSHLQQPIHVDDLAAAIVRAAEADNLPESAYNVAGPSPISFREIIEQTAEALDRRARMISVPLGPIRAGLSVYERCTAAPRLKAEQLDRLEEDKTFDNSPAANDLGHDPRPFADGIAAEVRLLDELHR